jgi:hypothetical protein
MWTTANRKSYERQGLRYPSDMTEAGWALVMTLPPHPGPVGSSVMRR